MLSFCAVVEKSSLALISVDLAIEPIFFVIQLLLLGAAKVTAVHAGIGLFLPAYSSVFGFELTVMSTQFTFLALYFVVQVAISLQNFGPARVTFPEAAIAGDTG